MAVGDALEDYYLAPQQRRYTLGDALDQFYFYGQERRYSLGGRAEDIAEGVQDIIAALPEKQRIKIQSKIDKVGAAILKERAREKIEESGKGITDFFNRNPIALFGLIGLLIFKMVRK